MRARSFCDSLLSSFVVVAHLAATTAGRTSRRRVTLQVFSPSQSVANQINDEEMT
jgi:hypothetical protein